MLTPLYGCTENQPYIKFYAEEITEIKTTVKPVHGSSSIEIKLAQQEDFICDFITDSEEVAKESVNS